jgi:SAM-dependent methyltransferase/uncharacterized protein YbaR (Trm112 family)
MYCSKPKIRPLWLSRNLHSRFLASKESKEMKRSLPRLLCCLECRSDLKLTEVTVESGDEVIEGTLTCVGCGATFSIRSGVPVFLGPGEEESHVAHSFGFEWQTFHEGGFERDRVFGLTIDEDVKSFFDGLSIQPHNVGDALVLDAGCGSGALTVALAKRYPEATFIALDVNPAIAEVFHASRDLQNLHVVRASVFAVPFGKGAFDLIWCNGVLHHTGNTRRGFDELSRVTRMGGRLYIWLYERKPSPLVAVRKLLEPVGLHRWNHRFLYGVCWLLSVPTFAAVQLMGLLRRLPAVQSRTRLKIVTRKRGLRELVLTWFDVLSPKYRDTYSQDEVCKWFSDNGFEHLSLYWWPVGVSGTLDRSN